MAMMVCLECKGQVSDQALACPHCGYPTPGLRVETAYSHGNSTIEAPLSWPHSPAFPEDPSTRAHYRDIFDAFDSLGGQMRVTWCWPAVVFPVIWYLVKGLWVKPIFFLILFLWLGHGALGLTLVSLVIAIYSGLFGKYDYYLWSRYGKQFA